MAACRLRRSFGFFCLSGLLRTVQHVVGRRAVDAGGETEEGLEGGHRGPPAVEAEGELVEVHLEVVVADAVVGAGEPSLEVAKDPMDVRQELGRPGGGSLRARTMTVPQVAERGIGLPRIRQDESAGGDGALHEARQRARRGIRHDVESDATGGRPAHFHRADDQRLVHDVAAALQADLRALQIGLIHLDHVLQRLPLVVLNSRLELLQGLGETGSERLTTLSMGALGVNRIGITDVTEPGWSCRSISQRTRTSPAGRRWPSVQARGTIHASSWSPSSHMCYDGWRTPKVSGILDFQLWNQGFPGERVLTRSTT